MSGTEVEINGVRVAGKEGVERVIVGADQLMSVRVPMPGEARADGDEFKGAENTCLHCEEPVSEMMVDGEWVIGTVLTQRPDCPHSSDGEHEMKPIPLSWLNSLGLALNPDEDQIQLHVSVGDPRGAMTFTLRRYFEKGVEHIAMHLPSEKDGTPHVPLKKIDDGTYLLT